MKRYLTLLLSAVLILSLFTACGSSSASYDSAPEEYAQEAMAENNALSSHSESGQTRLPDNRKWVITSEVRTETENLDTAMDAVLTKANELQGYIQDQSFENGSYYGGYDHSRSARLVVRIPAELIDDFMNTVEEKTNVVSSSRNLQDITLQYSDTETRIAALEAEEARLLEFMDQAENMADLLEIERRLTDVHYELENVTSRLRTYDNQVNYATIHLNIDEVKEYTPVEEPTFLERITSGFADSVEGVWEGLVDLTVLIIVSSPYLVVWGLIILAIVLIVKACNKKKAAKVPAQKKAAPAAKEIPEDWKSFDSAEKTTAETEEKKK